MDYFSTSYFSIKIPHIRFTCNKPISYDNEKNFNTLKTNYRQKKKPFQM
ncbi:hypothetical protein HMPREF0083_03381 [Aneurinibacillus aneurinilyticus ATCC 12856]|uniref:Uncharacterized protein n=1 Tax=Aneurinibacillus aneurinilyticus ATCC 12856 TaxID=649747 RepID=U1YCJ6_ANEAE|nr:hypothetical protein HMPREF0083_03381 [Aneurinibacillus aneurinilyticus ATCC 12856]